MNSNSYLDSIQSHSETIEMLLVITNMANGVTFKLGVKEEPIMNLKLKIEESQAIAFGD